MNLTITPNFQKSPQINQRRSNTSGNVLPNSSYTLSKDTVSFSARPKAAENLVSNTLKEVFRTSYENRLPAYEILSVKFMDALESVANKLKDYGVSFDRPYCEQGAVKKTDSFLSKFIRSGATPSDQIRATLYVENPYDLDLISNKILPELKIRGYEIRLIPDEVVGTRVKSKKPDFDIRLADVPEEALKALPEELQKSLSHPQKSGYEDIQMRLIDTLSTGKNKPPHELLIVFGKNYAAAKHNESYYVYDITRALKNVLHIAKVEKPELHSPARRVIDNIAIISEQLNNFISKPLFINAKNLDFYKEEIQLPVEISKANCESLRGLVEGIRSKIPLHYKAELTKVNSDDFKPELEKLVKNSQEFKERKDKTVYVEDIRNKKNELNKQLKEHKNEDMKLIQAIQARLTETIEKYGLKS